MIAVKIDLAQLVDDLNAWGWCDYKIQVYCGLGGGYINRVRCGKIREPSYGKAARLFNFWEEESALHASRGTAHVHASEPATT